MTISWLYRLGILLALVACGSPEKPSYTPPANPLFVQLSPEETGLTFQNTVVDDSTFNVITYRNFYNGGVSPSATSTTTAGPTCTSPPIPAKTGFISIGKTGNSKT